MQWLDQLPFADNRVVQIGFLAACGIAALIVLAILYRLVFAHRLRVPGGRTRQPRLGLVDAFSLDGQRQLVLVRRDNVEHLVMIGGPNDVLIESQINRALTPARENNQASPLLAPGASGRRTEAPLAAAPVVAEAPSVEGRRPGRRARASGPKGAGAGLSPRGSQGASAAAACPRPLSRPAPAPATATVPAPASRPGARGQTNRTGAGGAPRFRLAPGRTIARARSPGAGEFAAAASRPGASGDASADRSRERLRQSGAHHPPDGEGSPETVADPRQSAGRFRSRASRRRARRRRNRAPQPRPRSHAHGRRRRPSRRPAQRPPRRVRQRRRRRSRAAQKFGEARPPGDKPNAASSVKPSTKVDDPFADLDSLEAEMARLLGREKLS